MSTVRIPVFAETIGPIVDPHKVSFLTTKSWTGTEAFFANSLRINEVTEVVA